MYKQACTWTVLAEVILLGISITESKLYTSWSTVYRLTMHPLGYSSVYCRLKIIWGSVVDTWPETAGLSLDQCCICIVRQTLAYWRFVSFMVMQENCLLRHTNHFIEILFHCQITNIERINILYVDFNILFVNFQYNFQYNTSWYGGTFLGKGYLFILVESIQWLQHSESLKCIH